MKFQYLNIYLLNLNTFLIKIFIKSIKTLLLYKNYFKVFIKFHFKDLKFNYNFFHFYYKVKIIKIFYLSLLLNPIKKSHRSSRFSLPNNFKCFIFYFSLSGLIIHFPYRSITYSPLQI